MLSTMPRLVILKLKLPMVQSGTPAYAFAMMAKGIPPEISGTGPPPVTTVCAECGNGPSKSAASWISGAEWAPVRRLNSASRPRLRMARRRAALSSTCSEESKVTCDPSFVGARRLAAANVEGVRLIDNVPVTEIKTQRPLGPTMQTRPSTQILVLISMLVGAAIRARGVSDLIAQSSSHLHSLRHRAQLSGHGAA